jgi:hypothetical protein
MPIPSRVARSSAPRRCSSTGSPPRASRRRGSRSAPGWSATSAGPNRAGAGSRFVPISTHSALPTRRPCPTARPGRASVTPAATTSTPRSCWAPASFSPSSHRPACFSTAYACSSSPPRRSSPAARWTSSPPVASTALSRSSACTATRASMSARSACAPAR